MSQEATPSGGVILHYQITGRLGAGGMGVVFRALDLRLKRYVALKFLPPSLISDQSQRDRLLREATAASALEHPNIGAVHAIEETADGQTFIVMSCYDGETLKQRLSRGPLGEATALDIALQTARGLREAHSKGVIHRDIKPSNLIITQQGLVKIVDFGLAKILGGADLTQTMVTMGTAAYMSPEQALARPVDNRSDIWSLGVMLFEMLSLRLPFSGDTTAALLYAVVNSPLPPLDHLPPPMRHIIRKCLAKSPAERYTSIDHLIGDLESVQRTGMLPGPTATLQPAPAPVFQTEPRRRPLTIWMAAGALVVLVGAGAWWIGRKPPEPVQTENAPAKRLAVQAVAEAAPPPAPAPPKAGHAVSNPHPKAILETKPPELARYSGPKDGRMIWTGELEPGQVLDMTAAVSRTSVSGALPGEPVSIEIHPDSVHIVTPPSATNKWRTLVVRNEGRVRQVSIVVSWHVTAQ
ncbi:MAG TPA: protein kinase [Bryobacteraceae bacterium]|nr:protein kinase [Bryobacteraceae bacterium]